MEEHSYLSLPTWALYSKKLREKILKPRAAGALKGGREGMRLVIGEELPFIRLYLLVDEEDGEIADAKFQVYGKTILVGIGEVVAELILRKNIHQLRRVGAELIESSLRDHPKKDPYPEEGFSAVNIVLAALEHATEQCKDIRLPEGYVETPVDLANLAVGEYPDWIGLSDAQRIALISEVIAVDIRPYVELDDGGVEVKKMEGDTTVVIGYEGSCTTCYSATGSTLSAIQQILRAKVHPELVVKPDLGSLVAHTS